LLQLPDNFSGSSGYRVLVEQPLQFEVLELVETLKIAVLMRWIGGSIFGERLDEASSFSSSLRWRSTKPTRTVETLNLPLTAPPCNYCAENPIAKIAKPKIREIPVEVFLPEQLRRRGA